MTVSISMHLRALVLLALWAAIAYSFLSGGRLFKTRGARLRAAWDAAVKPIDGPLSFQQFFSACSEVHRAEPVGSALFAGLAVVVILLVIVALLFRHVGPRLVSAKISSIRSQPTGAYFIQRLRRMSQVPHRLLVIDAALSQVKSRYEHSAADPNRITQSLVAALAGLGVPFLCTETHELGAELVASYLY